MNHLLHCESAPFLQGVAVAEEPRDKCDTRALSYSHETAACLLNMLEAEAKHALARHERAKAEARQLVDFGARHWFCVAKRIEKGVASPCKGKRTRNDGLCQEHGDELDAQNAEALDRFVGEELAGPDFTPRSSFDAMERSYWREAREKEQDERAAKLRAAQLRDEERRHQVISLGPRIRHVR